MKIDFTVTLPVDVHSVPFVRGLCREALEHMAVERRTIDEVVLALTEACANVVDHAGGGAYEVRVRIGDDACRISVLDAGAGPDAAETRDPPGADADGDSRAERGQGLLLLQALVDQLDFVREPDGRHRVMLEKRLTPRAPLRLLDRPDPS
ncbi:ATP-binding protein [Geodermatophilus sp. YIM 151500]|uniref:ATP-binding protein n=1 Tax=Geodermatophilus sp. YIM 151500 TaxID=2984531 RepID=UPI0021E44DEB|nr:ATP-binding protein [Geodermatophilus sp. YIM 151500]MCV2488203.1 ATP-binding protein [Geodermatophilus sp. YIM 151500]